jgi:hypothetical protein
MVRRLFDPDPATGRAFRYTGYQSADLAYAITGHSAQSATVQTGIALVTGTENRQWLYPATTRGTDVNLAPRPRTRPVRTHPSQRINCYEIDYGLLENLGIQSDSRRYINAKTILLGDTGVGKSGLGLVLSGQRYQPTDSTHGRQVWTFDAQEAGGVDRR